MRRLKGCYEVTTSRMLPKGQSSWNIVIPLPRGANGKYKQKWVRFVGTAKEAERKRNELIGEIDRGDFVEPSKLTLGAWLDDWLDKAIRPPRRTQNTYTSYHSIVKNHLKPGLGHITLQQLSPLHIERYYAECGAKIANRTIALHHAILTSALNTAVRNGRLRQNIAKRAINRPRIACHEDVLNNVWTADEARQFLTHVKKTGSPQNAAFFALALDSGLRRCELLGLQWQDIDGKLLRLDRQLLGMKIDEATGAACLNTALPKGGRPRQFELGDETVALLREHRRDQAETKLKNRLHYADYGLVFAQNWEHPNGRRTLLGRPLNETSVGELLARFCKSAGVKRLTIHGLRHTCATLMLSTGEQPHVVQRRLGHKGIEMTLNLYAHVLPGMQADAAGRLAQLLHG